MTSLSTAQQRTNFPYKRDSMSTVWKTLKYRLLHKKNLIWKINKDVVGFHASFGWDSFIWIFSDKRFESLIEYLKIHKSPGIHESLRIHDSKDSWILKDHESIKIHKSPRIHESLEMYDYILYFRNSIVKWLTRTT